MKITNTESIGAATPKILIIGESGVGKTRLAATIKEPTLIVSAEAGLLSLSGCKIDVADISINDKGEMISRDMRPDRLAEVFKYLQTDEAKKKYKVIYVDSITEICQCLYDKLKVKYPSKSDSLNLFGELAEKMRLTIKAFRDLPDYAVVMTCLAVTDKDENGKRFIAADLIGKIAGQINQFLDEVFYMQIIQLENGTRKRVLQTGKCERMNAKDRSAKLNHFEDADLDIVFKKISAKPEIQEKKEEEKKNG